MEDGVGELRRLFEELGGFGRIGHYQAFHLCDYVHELRGRKGGEGFRDGVRTRDVRWEVNSWWQRW